MKQRIAAGVALVLLVIGFFIERHVALGKMEQAMIKVHGPGSRTPAAAGLVFEEMKIPVDGRELHAFYVPADGTAALLIFHGNNEAISGWVPALKLLHDAGITAMVFDYAGFGSSTGTPTIAHFREDGVAAWHAFRVRLPASTRACAYGLSLGSGVLLEAAPSLEPPPDCVAVAGAFTSARDAAVLFNKIPRWATFLLPDVLDNVEGAARLRSPLLIEHGDADELFPMAGAQRLLAAHPGAALIVVPGMKHGDPVVRPSQESWEPVIEYVKGRADP